MSAGKRVGVIILVLLLCAAAVVCGLVAAEYYTRQTGFGGAEIPLFIEKDADERIWLQVHALGMEQSYELTPEQFGYKRCDKKELTGGSPEENAEITRAILSGEEQGAKRQAVCLNAGAALYITGKTDTIEAGVRMAEKLIDSGAAAKKLEEFIAESLR